MPTNTLNERQHRDLIVLQQLKPYLAECLSLNHEINNPLAGIIGYAEYMLDDDQPLTEDQRHYVGQIMKCAERIRALVATLSQQKAALAEKIDLEAALNEFRGTGASD